MNQPYLTPPSFHPNAPPPHSSSSPPYQHAAPAQQVLQQRQEQQIQENISPQSHPTAHQNHIHNRTPSERQRAAVLTLRAFPNPTFFRYLKNFCSFLRRETDIYPNHLSDQQCQAFLALTDYSDELVLTLLNSARFSGGLISSQDLHNSSTLYNDRVAASFLTQSSSFVNNASIRNTRHSPFDQGSHNLSRDDSVELSSSSAASSNRYDRWCFICDNHNQPPTTLDSFKRHLRKHFTIYFCIPHEDLVYKEDGPRCAFCNFPNPDRIHLDTHSTECVGTKFSRRSTLIKHLKEKHGVHNGLVLADQFEFTIDQKYFACGFCVFCCGSLNELANHVDSHHYKYSQHIYQWDDDKVIRNLLSQPVVFDCWQAVLASNPPLQESWFRWRPTLVKLLKSRLEMSQEPAETLYNAAIDASNYRSNCYGYLEPVPADQGIIANQTIELLERQDAISPLSFNSEQSHRAYLPHTAAASPQLHHPARDWERPNDMDFDEGRHYPRVAPETYGSPSSPVYRHPSYRAQPVYPSIWPQSLIYSSSPASSSGTSRVSEGQARNPYYPRLDGPPPGLSSNPAINPRSRHQIGMYTTPAQALTDWNYPASTIESARSPSSREHNISPLSNFDDTYGPGGNPPVAAHHSRREPRNHRSTDIDSDSDEQQRFTQARGRSRYQRRDH